MDELEWLEQWYASQCNGDWEEQQGVTIESLDNPGWRLKVDLKGTRLQDRATDASLFSSGDPEQEGGDWVDCQLKNQQFLGAGDPRKLRALIRAFREWVLRQEGA